MVRLLLDLLKTSRHAPLLTCSCIRSSGFLLLDLLNVTDKYGPFPDMEFFVSSGDFQQVTKLSEDGTTFPMFSASGSKHFYDLVLPEATTTQYIK